MKGRALLRHLADISGPVAPGMVDELAERLGLDLTRPVGTLSKGNKQKVGLVQAFMHRPDLLVLDEPTSGLDPLVQREFLAMLTEARNDGQTVMLSSHVLSEVQQAADDVAVLAHGHVVAEGSVAALRIASVRRIRATVTATPPDALRASLLAVTDVDEVDVTQAPGSELIRVAATALGAIDPLIRALTAGTIRDLTVEEPDLEESVLSLYEQKGKAS
ncbi:ABC transporter ATP-binding protein [Microbacterium sp. LWH3-1.2]|uniref:ABC transporter ATP-binding protein n=1 Tax=Microbacterium sp. LWH3-1.2 TaxID=3135256 RepID=UPI00341EFD54